MGLYKIRKADLEFILISIYITSKMLWDQIPYIFELMFWMIVLIKSFEYLYNSIRQKRNGKTILFFIIIFVYVLANAIIKDTSLQLSRSIYEYIAYALVTFYFARTRAKICLDYCLKWIAYWGVVIAALTWYEYATKSYIITDLSEYGNILYVGINGFRATVFTRSFLSHGVVLGIFSLFFLRLWNQYKKRKYLLGTIFCYSAILATGSRGPLVAFSCAIIFYWFFDAFIIEKKSSKKNKFILFGMFGVLALMILITMNVDPSGSALEYFIYRIQNVFNWKGDAGNSGRIIIWIKSINDYFVKAPIFGIGPSKTGSWGDGSLGVTESGILKRLCELGIIGFILFYYCIYYIIRKAVKMCAKDSKKEIGLWLSVFLGIFINDITVQSTEEIMVAFWWWCSLGAIIYLKSYKGIRKKDHEKNALCYER